MPREPLDESVVTKALKEHGPSVSDDLPTHPGPEDRHYRGVRKFTLRRSKGGATSNPRVVYYIDGYHSPESVLRSWFEKNPKWTDHSIQGLSMSVGNYGEEFREALHEIADDIGVPRQQGYRGGNRQLRTCPFCGKEDIPKLPNHLTECGEAP